MVVWQKPPFYTKREQPSIVKTTIEAETEHVEKEPEDEDAKIEPKNQPQDTKSIPITILTSTIIDITPPKQPESPPAAPKADRQKGKVIDDDHSPPKLVKALSKVHLDKEEKIEKVVREARLSKPELIKVVHEEATKAGVDPKILISAKGGHDFGNFGITEWNELREIISKKKNIVVQDLLNSLSKRYEKPRTTLDELRIRSNLPSPGQVLSLTLGRKNKIQELEPETRILRLECNRILLEGITFVDNLVKEQPENGMFFIDVFGDEAFQRISDIHKIDVETLLTYLVMDLNISIPVNKRFCLALRSLIVGHPDNEKLKSKKVKLERNC
ncbi:hypothetical protein Tco_0936135 [Tanacetum coccineum]